MVWRIIKKLNGKTYYYVGKENRGRRVWSSNINAGATWGDKEECADVWRDETKEGAIVGSDSIEDLIEQAWINGQGWQI